MEAIGSGPFLPLALLAAFFIGLSKGGFANFGMLSVPLMALAMPTLHAASLLLPIYVLSDMVALWVYRRGWSRRNLAILVPAAFLGTFLGWAGAAHFSDAWMRLAIGLMGLAFCASLLRRASAPARGADVPRGLFWGVFTGLASFVSHSGAPPCQMYLLPQKLPPVVFAATCTWLFAAINLSKVLAYHNLGLGLGFSGADNALAPTLYLLLPVALAGIFCGWLAARKLPGRWFFRVVQAALFLVSCLLVRDGWRQILSA